MKLRRLEKGDELDLTPVINFTKSYETFRNKPYVVNGQTLIGYGSANPNLTSRQEISELEASKEVENKYRYLLNIAEKQIPNWVSLSNNVKYALLDTMYNGGEQSILSKSPKLIDLLNKGVTDGTQLSKEMDHSKSAGGWLGVRSAARRAMAQDAYDWNWKETDKYGRQIDSTLYQGEEDWKSSPYYNKYQKGGSLIYREFKPEEETIEKKARSLNLSDLLISDSNDRFPVEPVRIYKPMNIQPKEIKPQIDKTKVVTPVVDQNTSTGKVYKSSEKELFKQDMYNAYVKALKARGVKNPEAFAKRIVTQDILESNWGQSSLSKDFNFGGIKDFSEKGSQKDTVEYINGVKQTIKQPFKKFKDLDEYVNYKLDLVGRKWKVFDYNPEQYYDRLISGTQKYATDPNYVAKLNKLYDQIW